MFTINIVIQQPTSEVQGMREGEAGPGGRTGVGRETERRMREHIRAGKVAIEKQIAEGTFVPQWVRET